MKRLISLIVASALSGSAMAEYEAGQVWEYDTRPNEKASLLYIVKVESHERLGDVYHIHVNGLKIKNPLSPTGVQTELPHAPVNIDTLNSSLTRLVGNAEEMPDIAEGYQHWVDANGGVFNIPVKEILQVIEQAINQ